MPVWPKAAVCSRGGAIRPAPGVPASPSRSPKRSRRPAAVLALVAAGAVLAACGGSPAPDAAPASTTADSASGSSAEAPSSSPDGSIDQVAGTDAAAANGTASEGDGSPDGAAAPADGAGTNGQSPSDDDPNGSGQGSSGATYAAGSFVAGGAVAAGQGPSRESAPTGPTAPLTGLITTDTGLALQRAVAVKVGNSDKRARPQAGLAEADIVYEALIEGAKTRFLAVFHSRHPSRVGPVRSVRSSDIGLLADLSAPYLASSGANPVVLSEMRAAERAGTFIDIGGLQTFVHYTRDPERRSPYNLYFHYEQLGDPRALSEPLAPLFHYGGANPEGIADAAGVTVTFHRNTGNVVSHLWDAGAGGWVRIQQGDLMTTETDFGLVEVAPANVVVLWMPYTTSAADAESPQLSAFGTGDALVLTAGKVHEAVWERTEGQVGYRFADTAGRPLSLSPGSTWLLLANNSRRFARAEATVLTAADSARMLAEARAAAAAAAAAEANAAEAS